MENRKSSINLTWGYNIFQHVAGVIGAIAFAAFVQNFFDVGWRGLLLELISFWGERVRPLITAILNTTIIAALKAMWGWNVTIPTIVADYLGVGIITSTSLIRTYFWLRLSPEFHKTFHFLVFGPSVIVWGIFLWPYVIGRQLLASILGERILYGFFMLPLDAHIFHARAKGDPSLVNRRNRQTRYVQALSAAPVIYFCILWALNILFLRM